MSRAQLARARTCLGHPGNRALQNDRPPALSVPHPGLRITCVEDVESQNVTGPRPWSRRSADLLGPGASSPEPQADNRSANEKPEKPRVPRSGLRDTSEVSAGQETCEAERNPRTVQVRVSERT